MIILKTQQIKLMMQKNLRKRQKIYLVKTKKISKSKSEIKGMIDKANEEAEKNIIKTNTEFHQLMDNRKKDSEEKIRQMKEQALKDLKNLCKNCNELSEKLLKFFR